MSEPSVQKLLEDLRTGDRGALGRAITLVESTRPDHRSLADELLEASLPAAGDSIRVGITGVPGVGKSTFIDTLGARLTSEGRRVAVLAVDPTSRLSGGSILGDKTRMRRLASDPSAFVRPSPSGTTSGGVSRRTREVIILCEAAGYDTVFVETVGVGQAETAVEGMVDFFLLLVLAGAGDELQGIKRGIVEMADAIAVTKADGGNEEAAEQAVTHFTGALRLFPPTDSGWEPPVHTCSALEGTGVDAIWDEVTRYEAFARSSGYFETRRRNQASQWLRDTMDELLIEAIYADPDARHTLEECEARVVRREMGASAAAEAVLKALRRPR